MAYRTYKHRIVSLLARSEEPIHRSKILAHFGPHKETYILRALKGCILDGSIVDQDNVFSMNWVHANNMAVTTTAAVTPLHAQAPRATTHSPTAGRQHEPVPTVQTVATAPARGPTGGEETDAGLP